MKILAIRGRNITSLEGDFEVDFRLAPLRQAGLYAITGPTGSGKSSLLDAMCLALFDQVPRIGKSRSKSQSEVAGSTKNDVKQWVRRGASEAFAEVEFVGVDAHTYCARWEVQSKRGRDGEFRDQEITLLDKTTGQVLGYKKTGTLAEITRHLGLTFEQFGRSVLLAQGDFASFLRVKSEERASLLEAMTGTEIYSQVSMLVFERARVGRDERHALRSAVANLEILPEERRSELDARFAQEQRSLEVAREVEEAARDQVSWHDQDQVLATRQQEALSLESLARSAVEALDPVREELRRAREVEPISPLLRERAAATVAREDAEARRTAAAQARSEAETVFEKAAALFDASVKEQDQVQDHRRAWQPKLKAARELEVQCQGQAETLASARGRQARQAQACDRTRQECQRLVDREAELQATTLAIRAWCSLRAAVAPLIEQWPTWQHRFDRAAALESEIAGHLQALTKVEVLRQQRSAALSLRQGASQSAHRRSELLRSELDADQAAIQSLIAADPETALASLRTRRSALAELAGLARSLKESRRHVEAARGAADQDRLRASEAEARVRIASESVPRRREALHSVESLVEQLGKASALQAFRQDLRASEPCPLCGSEEHPAPVADDPELESKLTAARELLADHRRSLQAAEIERGKAQESLTHLRAALDRSTAAVDEVASRLLREEEAWRSAIEEPRDSTSLGVDAADLDSPGSAIDAEKDHELILVAQVERLMALRRSIDAKNAALREADQTLRVERDLEHLATRELGAAEAQGDQLRESLAAAEAAMRVLLDELGPAHLALGFEPPLNSPGIATLLAAAESAREEWDEHKKRGQAAEGELVSVRASLANVQSSLSREEEQLVECDKEVKGAQARLTELSDTLRELVGDDTVTGLESRLEERRLAAEAERERRARELSVADKQRSAAQAHEDAARTAALEADHRLEAARQQWGAAIEKLGTPESEVLHLLDRTSEWKLATEARLARAEAGWREAKGQLQAAVSALLAHRASARPESTPQVSAQALGRARAERSAAEERLRALSIQIGQDDHQRRLRIAKQAELIDLEGRYALLDQLNDLIGSKDGRSFRRVAQKLTLHELVLASNFHLGALSPRYSLSPAPGDELDLLILDHDLGGEVRNVQSLSGGETFLVSLALALGLSSLASKHVRVESLFIDEGFGTLDADSLDQALQVLERLPDQGCQVGLISHVPAIAERLPVKIQLLRTAPGTSRLQITAS